MDDHSKVADESGEPMLLQETWERGDYYIEGSKVDKETWEAYMRENGKEVRFSKGNLETTNKRFNA